MEYPTRHLYDSLAADYHLIFQDWEAVQARQARLIAGWLEAQGIYRNAQVLDCACGIGTQILGLASLGYREIWGTDSARVLFSELAGFTDIEIMEETLREFYQPVILARIGKKNMQEKEY